MTDRFSDVTEIAGTEITSEQLERMSHRYHWAASQCRDRDVVEVACGSGQGLGILRAVAKSLEAGDYSEEILNVARSHYEDSVKLSQFDAQSLPYGDASKDVVILFEAIYYIPDAGQFVRECRRVLRPEGRVLIATANKDLADFNPSPFSRRYYGAFELYELFEQNGFDVEVFGHLPIRSVSWRQQLLRPAKKAAVSLGLVPKTMTGKKLLKRIVFGKLITMPAELPLHSRTIIEPAPVPKGRDTTHTVLYCSATPRA